MSKAWGDLRRRGPGPLVAVALSAIWPGLGHFGHRNGRVLVLGSATLAGAVVALGYVAARGALTLLVWSVTIPSLRVLMVASVVVLAFRAVVAADAYRTAARRYWLWRRAPRRFGTVLLLILMSAVIAAPHVVVIRFVTAQMALLSDVFDVTAPQTAIPTPVPTTTVPTTLTPGSGGGTPGTSVALPQATSVVPTTVQPPSWDGAERALLLINSTLMATVIGLAYTATTLLTWSVTRSSLQILMAGALVVLVFRAAVTVDAYRTAALRYPPRRRSVVSRFGTFVTRAVDRGGHRRRRCLQRPA